MDIFCPGPLVRDDSGRPIGCNGLTCHYDRWFKEEIADAAGAGRISETCGRIPARTSELICVTIQWWRIRRLAQSFVGAGDGQPHPTP